MNLLKLVLVTLTLISLSLSAQAEKKDREAQVLALTTYSQMANQWHKDMLSLHERMYQYAAENAGKIKANHLEELVENLRYFDIKIHRPLTELGKHEIDFLGFRDFFEIQTNGATIVEAASRKESIRDVRSFRRTRRNSFRFRTIKVKRYKINPQDEKGLALIRDFKVQFLTKLLSLDNYLLGISPFMAHKEFRKIIMKQVPKRMEGTSENLRDLWFKYINDLYKKDTLFYAKDLFLDYLKASESERKENDKLIDQIIEKSITFEELKNASRLNIFRDILKTVKFMTMRRNSVISTISSETVYALSKIFGNTTGMYQARHGKLYSMSKEEEEAVAFQYKPLDILMEKTPFRLTDKFIPGHWGHTAVWVGTEKELKELDVWDELPAIYENAKKNFGYKGPSFQEKVRKGHHIVEALRPGIQLNTLRHFLEIDDLAAVRMPECEDEVTRDSKGNISCLNHEFKKKYLIKAFQQIGKDYDFNFDVNTERQIVCSELPYRVFLDVDFEVALTVGRHNISPDQVAKFAIGKEKLFQPFMIYFDGVKVEKEGDDLNPVFEAILKRDYDLVEELTGIQYNP